MAHIETADVLRKGDLVAEKYRVHRILDAGGRTVVVAARHIYLDQLVAIKFCVPAPDADPTTAARFARAARAAAMLKSEHVARVYDVGALDNGSPFVVMELLQGVNLAEWLREHGPLQSAEAVEFTLQACEALAEAHSVGIVHRDLKPSNLFRVDRAQGSAIKVLGFVTPKTTSEPGIQYADVTGSERILLGSPAYMSPEQLVAARDVDLRTDIWALGVTLYELLTARRPFVGESLPELCFNILHSEATSLAALRPDLPSGLAETIAKCLEKDRSSRYSNVAELALALEPYARERGEELVGRMTRLIREEGPSENVVLHVQVRRQTKALILTATALVASIAVLAALRSAVWSRRAGQYGQGGTSGVGTTRLPTIPIASPSSSVASLQERQQTELERAYRHLIDGSIAFPESMRMVQGRPHDVKARVSKDMASLSTDGMPGRIRKEPMKVSGEAVACLYGRPGDLDIRSLSGAVINSTGRESCSRQAIVGEFAEWTWSVTPIKWGELELHLAVSTVLLGLEGKETDRSLPTKKATIQVAAAPAWWIRRFSAENWQWIVGGGLAGALGGVWKLIQWLRGRRVVEKAQTPHLKGFHRLLYRRKTAKDWHSRNT